MIALTFDSPQVNSPGVSGRPIRRTHLDACVPILWSRTFVWVFKPVVSWASVVYRLCVSQQTGGDNASHCKLFILIVHHGAFITAPLSQADQMSALVTRRVVRNQCPGRETGLLGGLSKLRPGPNLTNIYLLVKIAFINRRTLLRSILTNNIQTIGRRKV